MINLKILANVPSESESYNFETLEKAIDFIKKWVPNSIFTNDVHFLICLSDKYMVLAHYVCKKGKIVKKEWYCKFLNEAGAGVEP